MSNRILWIDNDQIFLEPHLLRLEAEGYVVEQALTLTAGLEALESNDYDLLILDIMMPVRAEEDELFPERDTNFGKSAGAVFYEKCKEMLKEKGIAVLVFTIREEPDIRERFLTAGLPTENFMTKSQGADTADFLARVKQLLGE